MSALPAPMKTLLWNCRGLGNPWIVQVWLDIIKQQDLALVLLSKTKCQTSTLGDIKLQLGLGNVQGVNANGQFGDLALFWKKKKKEINITILDAGEHLIDAEIGGFGEVDHRRFTYFYDHPVIENLMLTWNLLRELASKSSIP